MAWEDWIPGVVTLKYIESMPTRWEPDCVMEKASEQIAALSGLFWQKVAWYSFSTIVSRSQFSTGVCAPAEVANIPINATHANPELK
jgi:hypothetical protein